jgi:hypothetical protein
VVQDTTPYSDTVPTIKSSPGAPKRYGPRRQTPSTQPISELDPAIGTRGVGPRLPLQLSNSHLLELGVTPAGL